MSQSPKLRYIIKAVPAPECGPDILKHEKVLQWYCYDELTSSQLLAMSAGLEINFHGEWRDVPTVPAMTPPAAHAGPCNPDTP